MNVIDTYLQSLALPQRNALERVRQIALHTLPEAEEVISYGMPTIKYKGKYVIGFSAFKDHLSVFPGADAVEAAQPKLGAFKTSKGTIKFTLDNPLPEALIIELVLVRLAAISTSYVA